MIRKAFLFVLSFAIPATALAWGQTGHRVIGAIAEKQLSKKAKKQIEELLGGQSLADASTWMDEVRSDDDYDHTHDWHWVSIPDGKKYPETDKNPDGDLVEAIGRMKAVIQDERRPREERAQALRFLVHLIGDIHQPLHVGTGEDRGGNDVKVEWFGRGSNLHRVWDSGMLDSRDYAFSELTTELCRQYSDEQIEQWQCGNEIDWAHEAMSFRDQVYNTGEKEYMGYEYTYQNWDLVKEQLMKGGVRLGMVLNDILG